MLVWAILVATFAPVAHAGPDDLDWQGRLLDGTGTPLNGEILAQIRLFDAASNGTLLATTSVTTLADDGFVDLTLSGFAPHLASGAPRWIEVQVGAMTLTPRQPLGAVPWSVTTSHVRVQTSTLSGACTDAGAIRWDATVQSLVVCDTEWRRIPSLSTSVRTVVLDGSVREWSDGTAATSCNGYRNPVSGFSYSGSTGSGMYRIDPDNNGTGMEVYCDQVTDNGGWTLVWKMHHLTNHANVGPSNTGYSPCNVDPYIGVNDSTECNIPQKWTRFTPTDIRLTNYAYTYSPQVAYDYVYTEPTSALNNSNNILPYTSASHFRMLSDNCDPSGSLADPPTTDTATSGWWTDKWSPGAAGNSDTGLHNGMYNDNCHRGPSGYSSYPNYGSASTFLFVR